MNTTTNVTNNSLNGYRNSSKYPIQFEKLHPGSLFRIFSEPDRGIRKSTDTKVYRRAAEHEGFFAYVEGDKTQGVVLMPFDLVQPVKKDVPAKQRKGK